MPEAGIELRGKVSVESNGKLTVREVERLHRAIGGDARTEGLILRFIAERYAAKSLVYLPPLVATEIVRRPADFIRAAKQFCEPELKF